MTPQLHSTSENGNGKKTNRNSRLSHFKIRRRAEPSTASIAPVNTVAGGQFAKASQIIDAADIAPLIVADVAAEIEQIPPMEGAQLIPMGDHETIETLKRHPKFPTPLKDFTTEHSGMSLRNGGGQIRGIGHILALVCEAVFGVSAALCHSARFVRSHGILKAIQLQSFSSLCGAMGSTTSPIIERICAEHFVNLIPGTVNIVRHRAGPISYHGLPAVLRQSLDRNAAACLAEDLEWVRGQADHPREIRELIVGEPSPIAGSNKRIRDLYSAVWLQAVLSKALRAEIDRVTPNAVLASLWGAVTILNSAYWHVLETAEIASEVAMVFIEDLKRVRATPLEKDLVRDLSVELPAPVTAKHTADELIEEFEGSPDGQPESFTERCFAMEVPAEPKRITATIAGSRQVESGWYHPSPATTPEFVEMLRTARSLGLRHEVELAKLDEQLEQLRPGYDRAQEELKKAIQGLYPHGRLHTTFASLVGIQTRLNRFGSAKRSFDGIATQYESTALCRYFLYLSYRSVLHDIAEQLQRLDRVLAVLQDAAVSRHEYDLVEALHVDTVLPNLLVETSLSAPALEEVQALLAKAVKTVTRAGLATIAGLAPDSSHEVIAACLAKETPPVECPPWGGQPCTRSESLRLILLPPMHTHDVRRIQLEIDKVDPAANVACVESAKIACVCDLQIVKPTTREQIFTSYFVPHFEEAKQQPSLHFVNPEKGIPS